MEQLPELKPRSESPGFTDDRPSQPNRAAAPMSDQELVAQLRDQSVYKPRASVGFVEGTKRRYRAMQLHREIQALELALQAELVEVGTRALESGVDGVVIAEERSRLATILSEIEECEGRRATMVGGKEWGSLVRNLSRDIEQLVKRRDEVLAQVGRKVCDAGRASEHAKKKIVRFETMIAEQRQELEELGSEYQEVDISPATWLADLLGSLQNARVASAPVDMERVIITVGKSYFVIGAILLLCSLWCLLGGLQVLLYWFFNPNALDRMENIATELKWLASAVILFGVAVPFHFGGGIFVLLARIVNKS